MSALLPFLLWLAGFIGVLWVIGAVWNRILWVIDGRPQLSQSEQLAADVLRAKGYTLTAARRFVIAERQNEFASQIASIRDTEDLISNPTREAELRTVIDKMKKQHSDD